MKENTARKLPISAFVLSLDLLGRPDLAFCPPSQVEQVTHIFSQETGFVTAIVPDLVEGAFLPNRGNGKLIPRFHPYSLAI